MGRGLEETQVRTMLGRSFQPPNFSQDLSLQQMILAIKILQSSVVAQQHYYATAWVTAVAQVLFLAQELPHATGAKKKKKKKKKIPSHEYHIFSLLLKIKHFIYLNKLVILPHIVVQIQLFSINKRQHYSDFFNFKISYSWGRGATQFHEY